MEVICPLAEYIFLCTWQKTYICHCTYQHISIALHNRPLFMLSENFWYGYIFNWYILKMIFFKCVFKDTYCMQIVDSCFSDACCVVGVVRWVKCKRAISSLHEGSRWQRVHSCVWETRHWACLAWRVALTEGTLVYMGDSSLSMYGVYTVLASLYLPRWHQYLITQGS